MKANIEEILRKNLPKEEGYQKTIYEAINYSILAGGKRIRPILMLETYKLFGGDNSKLVECFIVAIEMIHTYSLVHDDLPAMDNDLYRRGKKTTHNVYGEAMAILAGDGLLNLAFEKAIDAFNLTSDIKEMKAVANALSVLAGKSGINGMIGGQVCDIELERNKDITATIERLNFIYTLKTSALIESSMMIGAILAGAKDEEVLLMEEIAGNVGLAFQIKDDILDVISTQEILGKPVNSDSKNEKYTYVTGMSLEEAEKEVEKLSNEAIDKLDSLVYKNESLRTMIIKLISREY